MNEPLILIPGLMSDARLFGQQIIELTRDRAVTVALPHPGVTIEEISADILKNARRTLCSRVWAFARMSRWT